MTNPEPASDPAREPASGWLEGKTYSFPVRVYYEDTDLSGLVYHANYLRFMERGRSEFLRICGAGHRTIAGATPSLAWTVYRIAADFRRPARIEDALIVRTTVLELSAARMHLKQSVVKGSDILVNAGLEVCMITLDGRPRRIPESLREKLRPFIEAR